MLQLHVASTAIAWLLHGSCMALAPLYPGHLNPCGPRDESGRNSQRQFMKGLGVPRHSSGERVADASSWLRPYQQPLPLTPKGSSNAAEALSGGFEDKHPPTGRIRQKAQMSPWPVLPWSNYCLRWLQAGMLGKQQAHGCLTVILAHGGLEVGGRQIFGMGLMRAPLPEEAVANAAE